MAVLNHACGAGPLGSGGVEGSFLSSATLFLVFLRQLCRRCSTTCFLQKYHFFAHSPRGAVGGWWCWCCLWLSHVFLQVLRLLSHKLLARAAHQPQFSSFSFCPHSPFCPPSSPPPLLTLVFSPAVSSVPGTAAPRYSPTKTHMHFQTDEEEEEEEEEVKKRVCELAAPAPPGRPGTSGSPGPACLGDRCGAAGKNAQTFFRCLRQFLC